MSISALGDFGVYIYHYSGISVCSISFWGYQLEVYQFGDISCGLYHIGVYQLGSYQFGCISLAYISLKYIRFGYLINLGYISLQRLKLTSILIHVCSLH